MWIPLNIAPAHNVFFSHVVLKKLAYVHTYVRLCCASHSACPYCVCMIIIVLRTSLIYAHKWAVYSSHFCSPPTLPGIGGRNYLLAPFLFVTQCRSWRQNTGWCLWHPFSFSKRCCTWLNLVLWILARWARIYFLGCFPFNTFCDCFWKVSSRNSCGFL